MTLVCGTTLEIPFIPTKPVDALLANAKGFDVAQVTTSGLPASAIDTAVLKILAQGDRAAGLGITRLDPAALAAHPESYPNRLPQKAKNAIYLSHCNTPEDFGRAQEIWQALPPDIYDLRLAGNSVAGRFYVQGASP